MLSVHITTKILSSNPVHDEVYSMQHYVIKFVSYLLNDDGFFRVLRFPLPIKCYRYDITEISLKVAIKFIYYKGKKFGALGVIEGVHAKYCKLTFNVKHMVSP